MDDVDRVIDNPMYAGMSLKMLLESANIYDFGWKDLKGDEGKSGGKDGEKKEGEEWEQYNAGAAFLGPTLWDKTLSYDSDLKVSLEYMDLDEFLNENGIPIDETKRSAAAAAAAAANNGAGTNANSLRAAQLSPEAPSSPETPQMGSGMGACPQGATGPVPGSGSMNVPSATTSGGNLVLPPALSPQDYGGDCSSSVSSPGSPPLSPLQVHEPGKPRTSDDAIGLQSQEDLLMHLESARASQGRDVNTATLRGLNGKIVMSNGVAGATARPTTARGHENEVLLDYDIPPNDLALATVPGQDFDPRTRVFSEEELKPQPMIKKSRKQFVPVEMKDDKYWARRRKNNMAAKRSRDARRLKENQIAMRANFLEKENNAMTAELQKAQVIMESLKKRLAMYEAV